MHNTTTVGAYGYSAVHFPMATESSYVKRERFHFVIYYNFAGFGDRRARTTHSSLEVTRKREEI